jgi:hypothetical protein
MSLSASSSLRARLENAARVLNEMDALAVGNCALADLLREASAALDASSEPSTAQVLREVAEEANRRRCFAFEDWLRDRAARLSVQEPRGQEGE